jgi:hypothetical protein
MADAVPVDSLQPGEHACLTYSDEEERLDIVAAFVADGLAAGQQVVCFTDAVAPGKLREQLRRRDVAVTPTGDGGQLQVHAVEQQWFADGGFRAEGLLGLLSEQLREAHAAGYRGLRVTADMSWATRPLPGVEQLGVFETTVNDLFAGGELTSICQYDRQRFDAVTLGVVCDAHPRAVAARTYHNDALLRICRQYRPRGIRVAGEIDYRAVDALRAALSEAIRLDDHIDVNLTELRFIDATAAGEILNAAAGLPAHRRMTVRCTRQTARVLAVLSPSPPAQIRTVVTDGHE